MLGLRGLVGSVACMRKGRERGALETARESVGAGEANGMATKKATAKPDEQALHRMGFGYLNGEGKLVLSALEKKYISEKGIAKIAGGALPKRLEGAYAVYRYFRARGHIARPAQGDETLLRVWNRGVGREEERSGLLVKIVDAKWKADFEGIGKLVALAHASRKELVVASVSEGEVDFVKIAKFAD